MMMMNDDVYFVTSLMLLPFDQQQGLATANTFIQHTHTHINTHMQARYLGSETGTPMGQVYRRHVAISVLPTTKTCDASHPF